MSEPTYEEWMNAMGMTAEVRSERRSGRHPDQWQGKDSADREHALNTEMTRLRAELEALKARYDCPNGEPCKTCPCAGEDDVCFPGERLRVELERLREAAAAVIADWDRSPEFEPVSGEALRSCLPSDEEAAP